MFMNYIRSMNERTKWALGIFGALLIIAASFAFGWTLGINSFEKKLVKNDSNAVQTHDPAILDVGNVGEPSILPNTEIQWLRFFTECEHTLTFTNEKSYVGYTRDMIESEIEGARVISITEDSAVVCVNIPAYCPEHYMLIMVEQNELAVFKTNPDTLKNEAIMEIDFNTAALTPESIKELESGMLFRSLSEIDAYLENAET